MLLKGLINYFNFFLSSLKNMVPPMLTVPVDSILLRILEMKVLHSDAFIDNKHQLFLTVSCSLLVLDQSPSFLL